MNMGEIIMSLQIERITQEALELPETLRVQLAKQLIDSLAGTANTEVADAWWEIAERRVAEIDSGKTTGIPAAEAMRLARERIR
jgi:putative addiction module component (TIGR02574 family)